MSTAVILGSAFDDKALSSESLEPVEIETRYGVTTLYRWSGLGRDEAWVAFRHGLPHRLLPHQIPYRAQAAALAEVGCRALLVTSSVGVLDRALPLDTPMLVADLFMSDNRLPDGSPCTMFDSPRPDQGHLVIDEGLCSIGLGAQLDRFAVERGLAHLERVVFAFAMGPRTKTEAENALLHRTGAQVNSMTLAPEIVLANELEIPTAALVVGHKYSVPGVHERLDEEGTSQSLETSAVAMTPLIEDFLRKAEPVPFGNRIYRY
jgi:purine nucleoside phosphorylase